MGFGLFDLVQLNGCLLRIFLSNRLEMLFQGFKIKYQNP